MNNSVRAGGDFDGRRRLASAVADRLVRAHRIRHGGGGESGPQGHDGARQKVRMARRRELGGARGREEEPALAYGRSSE